MIDSNIAPFNAPIAPGPPSELIKESRLFAVTGLGLRSISSDKKLTTLLAAPARDLSISFSKPVNFS